MFSSTGFDRWTFDLENQFRFYLWHNKNTNFFDFVFQIIYNYYEN